MLRKNKGNFSAHLLILTLLLSGLIQIFSPTPANAAITYTGISPSSGPDYTWITLQGANLSHQPGRDEGYEDVYLYEADSAGARIGNYIRMSTSQIRTNPNFDGSIQVLAPTGMTYVGFMINVCSNWSAHTGCVSLNSTSTYQVTSSKNVATVGIHKNNGDADTSTSVSFGSVFQIPAAPSKANYVFKEWNHDPNGSGTAYTPGTEITINEDLDLYAQWLGESVPLIKLYLDAPFIQGSYASGTKVITDDFNSFTPVGQGLCSGETFTVGQVTSGTCSVFDIAAYGASTTSSEPVVGVGSSNNQMVSNYQQGGPYGFTITFPNVKKYVGFWWAAGSAGNEVQFLSNGQVVASINVNQLNGLFGSVPATDADYESATATIEALNGSTYLKKYYFGNPSGYTSTSPTVKSTSPSTTKDTPYVYIHAFADNGAYFDGVSFNGFGFEMDNLTVGQAAVPVNPRLVLVQAIEANSNSLNSAEKIYFATYHDDSSTAGAAPVDASSPYALGDSLTVQNNLGSLARTNFRMKGWSTSANGGGIFYNFGDSVTVTDDLEFYPVWEPTFTVTYNGNSNTGGSVPVDNSSPYNNNATVTVIGNSGTLERTNYTFEGWSRNSGGTGTTYSAGDTFTISSNVILYAKWNAVNTPPPPTPPSPPSPPSSSAPTVEPTTPATTTTETSTVVSPVVTPAPQPVPTVTPKPTPSPMPTPVPTQTPAAMKVSKLKKIGTVYFNNNEYFLDAKDRKQLTEIAASLRDGEIESVYVEGNTDINVGVDNVLLSQNRADAVRDFLQAQYEGANYEAMWFASSKPVAFGTSAKALAANRRVDIYIPVLVDELPSAGKAPEKKIFMELTPVTFNRNEFFLDARDRVALVENVKQAAKNKCFKISLRGSRDATGGKPNLTIAEDRVKAVQAFMKRQYPALRFGTQPSVVSPLRDVQISCTN